MKRKIKERVEEENSDVVRTTWVFMKSEEEEIPGMKNIKYNFVDIVFWINFMVLAPIYTSAWISSFLCEEIDL